MYLFQCEAAFDADPAVVWPVWTDVASWPEWDVSKEIARLDGEFRPGVTGWAKQRGTLGGPFTITTVEPGRRWVSECPLPLGKVIFDHVVEPVPGGGARVIKSVDVEGGFAVMFRLLFAPKLRRDIAESLRALGRRVQEQHQRPVPPTRATEARRERAAGLQGGGSGLHLPSRLAAPPARPVTR